MNPKSDEFGAEGENPFKDFKIDDVSFLDEVEDRTKCSKCKKSRKYFCYTCYVPVEGLEERVPKLKLPLKIDIIKHAREIDGKSTAAHAAVLAPDDVSIYTFPCVPEYDPSEVCLDIVAFREKLRICGIIQRCNVLQVVVVYPGKEAQTLQEYFKKLKGKAESGEPVAKRRNLGSQGPSGKLPESRGPARLLRAVFIDSTWNQSRGMFKDSRLHSLPTVVLERRLSNFWRHQNGSPRWYLATVEAIHQFLVEHHALTETEAYDGRYDNLLFFFRYMYSKIHQLYNHENLRAYKRPVE